MTSFVPHTPEERQAMLQKIGVASVDELFASIPASLQIPFEGGQLPRTALTELELQQHLTQAAQHNPGSAMDCFMGGGAYARFIPPAVHAIASRSEFYTAYTPYQPEISQGTLQMIYEFQTMLSELTGMDVTNASVYDGATALGEAAFMTVRATRRKTLYLSQTAHPHAIDILSTYARAFGDIAIECFDPHQPLAQQVKGDPRQVAGVIVQQPDYFGVIHDLQPYQAFCKEHGALLVVGADPVTLAVLEPPRTFGADIVCGDIQQFGNSINYGGPYGGFVATTEKLMRQLPGRLVGRTVDKTGKPAYTLTLQTREQHIRREKATSNICTNQSLNVLKASVYLSLVGPQGLCQIAEVSAERAHYLAERLLEMPGVTLRYDRPFLYEFALRLPVPARVLINDMAERYGILAGVDVGKYRPDEANTLLVAVTELNSVESLERYCDGFQTTLNHHGISVLPKKVAKRTPTLMASNVSGEVQAHG